MVPLLKNKKHTIRQDPVTTRGTHTYIYIYIYILNFLCETLTTCRPVIVDKTGQHSLVALHRLKKGLAEGSGVVGRGRSFVGRG